MRGLAFRHAGKAARALEYVDEGLALIRGGWRPVPPTPAMGRLLRFMTNERGEILDYLGSTAEARALFETYRQQALLDNDESHLSWALINLSLNACDRGQSAVARELMQAALRAADEGGSTPIQGDAQMAAGLVELLTGDPAVAVALEVEAVRKLQTLGPAADPARRGEPARCRAAPGRPADRRRPDAGRGCRLAGRAWAGRAVPGDPQARSTWPRPT